MKKSLIVLGSAAVLVAIGWLWLEQTTRPESDETAPVPGSVGTIKTASAPTLGETAPTPFTADNLSSGSNAALDPTVPIAEMAGTATEETAPATPTTPTAGDILAEPDEDLVRVAKKLAALVRDDRAPMAEREEALAHTLNLSAGNEAEVLTPLVTDPALPDPLAETILAEALNRPLAYQADVYLAALAVRKTPEMQTLIREHLAFLTGGSDLGPNPNAWTTAVNIAKKDWE